MADIAASNQTRESWTLTKSLKATYLCGLSTSVSSEGGILTQMEEESTPSPAACLLCTYL